MGVPDVKFLRGCFSLSWGLVLAALGVGILIALAIPMGIIVILLSCILVGVGCVCSLPHRGRRF